MVTVLCIGDEDFKSDNSIEVLFHAGLDYSLFDIHISDDAVLENNETFNISINPLSLPYGVILGNITSAEVIIMDDDSKYSMFVYPVNNHLLANYH